MRRRTTSGWRTISRALAIGLAALGLRPPAVPAGEFTNLPLVADRASPGSKENAKAIGREAASMSGGPRDRQTPDEDALSRGRRGVDAEKVKPVDERRVLHVGRVINSTAVSTNRGPAASRAAGTLGLADPCNCDEDCDAGLGDQCSIVQCIVRGVCSGDPTIPCSDTQSSASGVCNAAVAGVCIQSSFRQRCDVVQLIGWSCDVDIDFCTMDQCEDDGTGTGTSVCAPQENGAGGSLSACPKQCAGGPAAGLRCTQSSDCPQGSCEMMPGGGCDSAAEACYVGASLATAIGRCCASGTCSEMGETTCTSGGGAWYRYRDPNEQVGDGNCLCPKYGSGVAPAGTDEGSIGLVRPSGLVCTAGSTAADVAGLDPVYCEDPDGDGLAPQYCLRRCVGGDNVGALCEVDNPDCGRIGFCNGTPGNPICQVKLNGDDCGICSISGTSCDFDGFFPCPDGGDICEFPGGQTCPPNNPGQCQDDPCASNTIEGGCEDGFLNIGDDYDIANGSFLRLSRIRFRGGVSNQGEDIVLEFWDSTGTYLVDSIEVNDLDRTGTRDWTIEVDCWPNCNPAELEAPAAVPVIIPPNGYLVMRSVRTIGTLDGATAFWSQTDAVDVGANDAGKSWANGNPNADVGTNVYIFELVGVKVLAPFGACCDLGGAVCNDTLRWECGQCTPDGSPSCSSTLLDCPDGGLTGSVCQFNKWFGPISHNDFEFGGADQQLCDGLSPCDKGGCCQGGLDGFCTVEEETVCDGLGGDWLGSATDCDPDCCPKTPTGVDCICETWNCVDNTNGFCSDGAVACLVANNGTDCGFCDGLNDVGCSNTIACPGGAACLVGGQTCPPFKPGFVCDPDVGLPQADCDLGQDCEFSCAPDPANITLLRHPYECHDDFGSPMSDLGPAFACDPANGNADCTAVVIPCNDSSDCPSLEPCVGNVCDLSQWSCGQSFATSVTVTRTDTIAGTFGVLEGDACSLNTSSDRVGWYERFTLVDPTPGDGTDDCFVLTVSMCCTDPVLSPVWAFVSEFLECPCVEFADVTGTQPDIDDDNNLKAGLGPGSRANFPCDDENFSGTFTVPPGDYAYQVRAGRICVGSSPAQACDTDDDCEGVACVIVTPDYTLHFTVESCRQGACCINETCIVTNRLDCLAQEGHFLGDGDQPVNTCVTGGCNLGSCCLVGQCRDDSSADTFAECEALGGVFQGGVECTMDACPVCPFDGPANCQEVQTIFGLLPSIDRNPANGFDGETATVLADDVRFGGDVVDEICWNTWFFTTPCCGNGSCTQNIDDTWEIRIYDTDPGCPGIPGVEIGVSTITVLNKLEGTGSATGTWHYGGVLDTPIELPNGGFAGDTYWFEVSGYGEPGCEVHAIWSRDDGNDHHAVSNWTDPEPGTHAYSADQMGSVDVGFCEDGGLGTPPDVLGACCSCSAEGPGICAENFTQKACVEQLRGVWVPCTDCSDATGTCPGEPVNDDCASPLVITGIPTDGSELVVEGSNICATDDGPGLSNEGGCSSSLAGDGNLHFDMWYSYVAEACGELTIDSCFDADFDQMIAVYDAANGCPLTASDEIACADDGCGIGAGASKVTLDVAAGQQLLIRVGGWGVDTVPNYLFFSRGEFTLRFSFDNPCPPCQSPFMPVPPHNILKNRYISVAPNPCDPVLRTSDILLTLVSTQVNGVTAIGSTWWAAAPDADCISIVSSARPTTPPDWTGCPTVHLTGCPIIPTSTYHIRTVLDGQVSDPPLVAETQAKPDANWHGDCVGIFNGTVWTAPNGVTSIDDAVAAIKTFQNPSATPGCGAPPCNATHVSVTDMEPNLPGGPQINSIVNIADVFSIILGFRGEEYPGPQIELCP